MTVIVGSVGIGDAVGGIGINVELEMGVVITGVKAIVGIGVSVGVCVTKDVQEAKITARIVITI